MVRIQAVYKTGETRVWRTYTGGKALDAWHGREGENGHFPEDWAASTTRAINAGREEIVEGLSRVTDRDGAPYLKELVGQDPEAFFGKAHLERYGENAGFLVKLIDAAERLALQVHPDKEFALKHFGSTYGKTESWYIIGGNSPDAQPHIYFGFKPGVTREQWRELFDRQDIQGMLDCMNRIPVKTGDCFFISAGVPHAIGEGCFLAEIQEPTDYTLRVERKTPGGYPISEAQLHMGLGYDLLMDCFHYDGKTEQEAREAWQSEPMTLMECEGGHVDSLIDERKTDLFTMHRVLVEGQLTLPASGCMSILMVIDGAGNLSDGAESMPVRKGDVLVTSAECGALTLTAEEGTLHLVHCFPPKA